MVTFSRRRAIMGELDYPSQYLTLEILSAGTIGVKTNGSIGSKNMSYSVNGGEWTEISSPSNNGGINYISDLKVGDRIRLKGTNTTYATSKNDYMNFEGGTATFDIYGNIMSLTNGDNFIGIDTVPAEFCFASLFKLSPCISAENLILPASTLKASCYRALFSKASTLLVAPKILPATTLAQYVYWYMFEETNITKSPILPYVGKVPAYAYGNMFMLCPNLNYVTCLATDVTASAATQNWLSGVSSNGTFIKNSEMSSWSSGINGIPKNWQVYDSDVNTKSGGTLLMAPPNEEDTSGDSSDEDT